jgi:hypothetical protein
MLPLLTTLFVGSLLLPAADLSACPNCKAAVPDVPLTQSTDGGTAVTPDIATGYFWSILFMIAVPFTLAATMGTALYVTLRRTSPLVQPSTH